VFVGSLALFIVTLTSGTSFARGDEGAHLTGRSASVGAIGPLRPHEPRPDLQPADPSSRARRRLVRAGASLRPARCMSARRRRRSLPSRIGPVRQSPKSLHSAN
jgi:hypothetical protein